MFKNYLILTLRNLGKNSVFVIINIVGLALALAICITAYMNNKYNADWDKFHENYDDIYKISITKEIQDRQQDYGVTPYDLGEKIKQDIPQVKQVVRTMRVYSSVKYGENIFNKRIGYTDDNFAEVFTIDFIQGNEEALKDKANIVISDDLAGVYFGDEDPMGKIISVFNDENVESTFVIAGVFKALPSNSSFRFEALTHMDNYYDMWELDDQEWQYWVGGTWLVLDDDSQIPEIEEMLAKYIPIQNEAREDFLISSFFIEPFKDVASNGIERWAHWFNSSMHPAAVAAPPIMAILILIITCFNFTNTSIAFAGKRLKEIGLRKVFGGHRKNIIIQFLSENFIMTLLAILLGMFLAKFLVPMYAQMWEGLELVYTFKNNIALIIFLILLLIGTTLIAGAYPAFYISRFNAVKIFREKLKLGGRNLFSKILLGVQFSISVIAIYSGVIFSQNAYFQDNLYLGYDKDNTLVLNFNNAQDYKPFEQLVKSMPDVEKCAGTTYHIGYGTYTRTIKFLEAEHEVDVMHVGYDYLSTMGVEMEAGREFKMEYYESDVAQNAIIINQKAQNDFGMENPIGKTIFMNDTLQMRIIGMVKDYYPAGMWAPIDPLIIRTSDEEGFHRLAMRCKPGRLTEVNEALKAEWTSLIPNYPFQGMFQEEIMEEAKQINKNIKQIFVFLGIIACIMSAMGLFTLVSLAILNKTKEIGIRKVMGASVGIIMRIVNKPFAIIVTFAALAGIPGGYFLSKMLMDSIWDVFTDANYLSFVIPLIMIFGIAGVTTTYKIFRAAIQNPAQSLRYE